VAVSLEFALGDAPEQRIASIRARVAENDVPMFIGRSFEEIYGYLARLGVGAAGHPFAIYHEFGPDGIDTEICAPVAVQVPPAGSVRPGLVPATTVVSTVYVGPYEEIAATYEAMMAWIRERHLEPAGPVRERYLTGPSDAVTPAEYRTEIEIPVAAAAVPAG
jgi:effector-binding domain-containing protein